MIWRRWTAQKWHIYYVSNTFRILTKIYRCFIYVSDQIFITYKLHKILKLIIVSYYFLKKFFKKLSKIHFNWITSLQFFINFFLIYFKWSNFYKYIWGGLKNYIHTKQHIFLSTYRIWRNMGSLDLCQFICICDLCIVYDRFFS